MATSLSDTILFEQHSDQEEKLEAWRHRNEPVSILVIGPTGAGKSTLINALFGKDLAEVGHRELAVTSEIKAYEGEYKGVRIKVYDTIGFGNTGGDTGGKSYHNILLDIAKCGKYDLILICIKLGDKADPCMFLELASVLHEDMWKRTVVVLTFANFFVQLDSIFDMGADKAIKEKIYEYKKISASLISKSVKKEVLEGIPFCIAGMKDEKKLPITDDWLSTLWETCIDHCSDEARPFLSFYARNRDIIETGTFLGSVGVGASVGATVGSFVPVAGTAIGAGIGAAVGGAVSLVGIGLRRIFK